MFKSLLLSLVAAVSLTACSQYLPLYAQGATTTLRIGDVQMKEIQNTIGERRVAQSVHRQLKHRFPADLEATYTLFVDIEESKNLLAVDYEGTEGRGMTTLVAVMKVLDQQSKQVLDARVQASSSYTVEDEPMATEAGVRRARESAGYALTEAISQRMFQFLQSHNIPLEK